MMKAYDRVIWDFICSILKRFVFVDKWVKWILSCISTTSFFVLVHGSPCGFFSSCRGTRQGDPMSPFLFIIMTKGLSKAIKSTNLSGSRKGINIPHLFEPQSNYLFSDDTFLFGQAMME